jgi:GT2 family glycosyltransferase
VVDDGLSLSVFRGLGIEAVLGIKPFCFARNMNLGIKAADTDDVILMNDDALLVSKGGFTRLAEAAVRNPEYGILSSACNNVGNPNQWPVRGGGIAGAGIRGGVIESIREDRRMVCFIAVYIPRATIGDVGLLDEELTGYGYDDDLYCARVRAAGLKIGIYDGCFVDHSKLPPTFRRLPNVNELMNLNRAIFARKGGGGDPRLNLKTRTV